MAVLCLCPPLLLTKVKSFLSSKFVVFICCVIVGVVVFV